MGLVTFCVFRGSCENTGSDSEDGGLRFCIFIYADAADLWTTLLSSQIYLLKNLKKFLIGGKLLYIGVVLVSAIQQHKSAIITHLSPPSWVSLPSPQPTPSD